MIPTTTLSRYIHHEQRKYPGSTGELSDLLTTIALAVKMIGRLVQTAGFAGLHGYTGEVNVQGEDRHKVDDEADSILIDILGTSGCFSLMVSEERSGAIEPVKGSEDASYIVAFDPLDGSSNIGSNIPVGTIFTIFRKIKDEPDETDFFQDGSKIVAAGYSVYGAKTSFVYSCGDGVHGFTLDPTLGEFILTEDKIKMPEQGSYYSVNEGYWSVWEEETTSFVQALKNGDASRGIKPYSARYVGSLVADFDRTLRKGGIFLHPGNKKRKDGKLRLLYECLPLAFIAEQAGGQALTAPGKKVLDVVPENIHQRVPFICGGAFEAGWYSTY